MEQQVKQATAYPLRMPLDVREKLQERAHELDRSLHWVIVKTLRDGLNVQNKD
jgi:predicted transcriptional regulator